MTLGHSKECNDFMYHFIVIPTRIKILIITTVVFIDNEPCKEGTKRAITNQNLYQLSPVPSTCYECVYRNMAWVHIKTG